MKAEPTLIDLGRLRVRRGEILDYAASHGAQNVRVFGSAARGGADATSDVDLLVEMEPGRSLLDLVGPWQDLEDLLGTHVDVLAVIVEYYPREDLPKGNPLQARR
jgi:predicted nucleotidyltransferase